MSEIATCILLLVAYR